MISDPDNQRIVEAIRAAEAKTSGEIYCVIAHACGQHHLVPIAWAALVALVVPLPLIRLTAWPASVIYVLQLISFIAVAIAVWRPAVRFRIVPPRMKRDRAHAEAMRQFWAHGLHLTQRRTGVLIFVAVAERYAEVIADAGIGEKVAPEVWSNAIKALTTAVKAGRLADGLVAAVEQCGAVLAEHFPVAPGEINPDELPDKVVVM